MTTGLCCGALRRSATAFRAIFSCSATTAGSSLVVDLDSGLGERLVLAGPPLLLILEHLHATTPMPRADLLRRNSPTSIKPAHRRPAHPQQIRACCVVNIIARGATVTARPDPSAATTCLRAACTSAGNST
ncbi:hypothetical protein ACFSUH_00015 [Rhodococcus jostii]|uniref:hypothetical protein n=1 Tax=Rhodococcus jostii TaxID=132919 RepID=UPI00362D64BF